MVTKKVAITGISFCTGTGRTRAAALQEGEPVDLERINHPNDRNAVMVQIGNVQIGWVAKIANPPIAEAMDAGRDVVAVCSRAADMRKGRIIKEPMMRISWEE